MGKPKTPRDFSSFGGADWGNYFTSLAEAPQPKAKPVKVAPPRPRPVRPVVAPKFIPDNSAITADIQPVVVSPPCEPPAQPEEVELPAGDEEIEEEIEIEIEIVEFPPTEEDPGPDEAPDDSTEEETPLPDSTESFDNLCVHCKRPFRPPPSAPNRIRCRYDYYMMLEEASEGIMKIRRRQERKQVREAAKAAEATATGEVPSGGIALRQKARAPRLRPSPRISPLSLIKYREPAYRNIENAPKGNLGNPTPAEKYLGEGATAPKDGDVSSIRQMRQHKLF